MSDVPRQSGHALPIRHRPVRANSGLMQGSNDGCRNPLLNHLVSAGEQRGWDVEAERLRSFEIDG
jgi:hypothetical protein